MGADAIAQQRQEIRDLWGELEPWVATADAWTASKEETLVPDEPADASSGASPDDAAAAPLGDPPAAMPDVPDTPAGPLTPHETNDVEEWRHLFRDELASFANAASKVDSLSPAELAKALEAGRRLVDIPRRGFRGPHD